VASALDGIQQAAEAVLDHRPAVDNGYILTKWAAEQLVAGCAHDYGLPAVIARPGNITGDSRSGYSNFENNHFWMFTKGCWQLGAYPEMPAQVEMTPVDLLARSIANLALAPHESLLVANLSNPNTLSWQAFFALLGKAGVTAQQETAPCWQQRLEDLPEGNALAPIRHFYQGNLSHPPLPVEHAGTVAALRSIGLEPRGEYSQWAEVYVDYLRRQGFFAGAE
jgi:thioester reductase-like protein